jgi:hypothetical protein
VTGAGGRRRRGAAIAIVLLGAPSAGAQSLRGSVVAGTHPVGGAVVVLLDSLGEPAGRALSRDGGEFFVTARQPGSYRARVLRIGYAATTAGPFRLSGGTVSTVLRIESAPVRLGAQVVQGSRVCDGGADSAPVAFALWEQARTALLAASLTQANPYTVRLSLYQRDAGLPEQRHPIDGPSTRPYQSMAPDTLATRGYIHPDGTGFTYWAPDADVLLSPSFVGTHCFSLSREGRSKRVAGISFAPQTRREEGAGDIRGTFWVDRLSKQLRALDFQYTDGPAATREIDAGGHVEFAPLPDGGWIVPHWEIRVPVPARAPNRPEPVTPGQRRSAPVRVQTRVIGGDVEEIRRDQRVLWQPGRVSLSVRLADSSGRAPAPGTLAWISEDSASAHIPATDDAGIVHLDNVRTGARRLRVLTGLRDSLGLAPFELSVRVDSGATDREPQLVVIPRDAVSANMLCEPPNPSFPRGMIYGAAPYAAAMDTTKVVATWEIAYRLPRGGTVMKRTAVRAEIAPAGRYHVCDVPIDVPVKLRVERGIVPGGEVVVEVPREQRMLWKGLSFP